MVLLAECNQVFPPSADIKVQQFQCEQLVLIHAPRVLSHAYKPTRAQILGCSYLLTLHEAFFVLCFPLRRTYSLLNILLCHLFLLWLLKCLILVFGAVMVPVAVFGTDVAVLDALPITN